MLEYLLYIANEKIQDKEKKIEPFSAPEQGIGISILIFSLVIGIFCIYLSWRCNTMRNTDLLLKILYAFFAWFFGIFYLIFYFFTNYLGNGCGI